MKKPTEVAKSKTRYTCSMCSIHLDPLAVDGGKYIIELCDTHRAAWRMKATIAACLERLNRHVPETGYTLASSSDVLNAMLQALTYAHIFACGVDCQEGADRTLDELKKVDGMEK